MTTFGFEAEFQTNAAAVIAGLYDRNGERWLYAGDRTLHPYHCDCDHCCVGIGGPMFRGQTDSSCSGEVISDILTDTDAARNDEAFRVLAEVAVEVDAEPGENSGLHVHVGIDNVEWETRMVALYQFLRWEDVLMRVAGGRWSMRRDGMNSTARQAVARSFAERTRRDFTTRNLLDWEQDAETEDRYDMASRFISRLEMADRHNNLNISARHHPTWEFRLWNSTRSAWRIEMFCGLSMALLDEQVINGLADLTPPTRFSHPNTGVADLALAVSDGGFGRTAELLERQSAYLRERVGDAPMSLTIL